METKKLNKTNLVYTPEIISLIIDEYKIMHHQFLSITQEEICIEISEYLNEVLGQNEN